MRETTWDKVLRRSRDFIGGDLQFSGPDSVFRGPIRRIDNQRGNVCFWRAWCAELCQATYEWCDAHNEPVHVSKGLELVNESGSIIIFGPDDYRYILLPRDRMNLSSEEVRDLAPNWERLLALYPRLPLDWPIVRSIMRQHFPLQPERNVAMMTVHNFLKKRFCTGSAREEFLWWYISAVTGEKKIHEKVY